MTYNLRSRRAPPVADTLSYCATDRSPESQHPPTSSTSKVCRTLLTGGGAIGTLFALCKVSGYKTLSHGITWLGWNVLNQATAVPEEKSNILTWYINTQTQLREQGEQGYFEGYRNITLALATVLGTAIVAKCIYNKYMK